MSHANDRTKDAIHEGAATAREAAGAAAERSGQMISEVRGYAEHVVEQSREGLERVVEQAQQGLRKAGALIRENPGISISAAFGVGIGMGIGVIIGLSLRRPPARSWHW